MSLVSEFFGCNVFSDEVMKERLPEETYKARLETTKNGHRLNPTIASALYVAVSTDCGCFV